MLNTVPRVAQKWMDAWNSHQVERILDCLAEGAVYEDLPLGAVNRTKEEARQFIEAGWAGFPDLRFELTAAAVSDGHGTAEWVMSGTHQGDFPGLPATGKSFSVRGVSVMEVSGDTILNVRDYWDFAAVPTQLGFLPAPETA